MQKRRKIALVGRVSLLSLAIVFGILAGQSNLVSANSGTQVSLELCTNTEPNPTIVTTPINNAVVNNSSVTLQFQTKFVHKLTIKQGVQTIASFTPVFDGDQSFSHNLTLVEGVNDFSFEINGGCPRYDSVQAYRLTYNPLGTTLDEIITNQTSPSLSGEVGDPSHQIEVEIDGQTYPAINNGDGTWTLPAGTIEPALADGVYDVKIITRDDDGVIIDQHTFPAAVTIDTVAPELTIETTSSDQRSPKLSGRFDKATRSLKVTINGKTYDAINNGDGTWTLPAGTIQPELASGTYDIIVHAVDLAGNETTITEQIAIKASGDLGFVLAPNTGYLRIGKFNLPSWALYLAVIALITGLVARKQITAKAHKNQ